MLSKPLVTVYMPTHNRPDLFKRALNSVLQQTYTNFELIVIDDGSSEQVQNLIQTLCNSDPRVILVLNTKSSGACAARNQALSIAKGTFITGIDDDDEFTSHRLEQFVSFWLKHPNYAYLCTGYRYVIKSGAELKSWRLSRELPVDLMLHSNHAGNQIFTRTDYVRAVAGFDNSLVACQDYDLWIRLSVKFGTGFRLFSRSYIVHEDHDSPRISTFKKRKVGHQQLIDKHADIWTSQQLRSQMFFQALYSGEQDFRLLWSLSGLRHGLTLLRYMLARF